MKLSLGLDQAYRKGVALGLLVALLLVSGRVYIEYMRVNSATEASGTPVFIEVPKPVILMTPSEKDEFVEEILKALDGK